MGWLNDVLGLWRTWRRARAIARHLAAADHAARQADFHHQRAGWFIRDRSYHIARANDLRRGGA